MKQYVTTLVLLAACGFAGAQTNQPIRPAPTQPQPQELNVPQAPVMTPGEALQQSGGSLLRATASIAPDPNQARISNVSFFAVPEPGPRVLKKHDLVTIIVREESESTSEATTDLKKDASLEAKIDEWIKLNIHNLEIEGGAIGPQAPSVKMSGKRNFKGEATVDRTDSLLLRVTAEVIDVKPNGTVVLQARQRIKTDEEVQEFTLSGICRAEDVTPDNTILSTQLFDKEVTKSHKGAVKDTTQRGWIPKLLDLINPF